MISSFFIFAWRDTETRRQMTLGSYQNHTIYNKLRYCEEHSQSVVLSWCTL